MATAIVIDPTKMTAEEAKLLTSLVETNKNFYKAGVNYPIKVGNQEYRIAVTRNLYRRQRKEGKDDSYRWEVRSAPKSGKLGQGGFGKVYEIDLTLKMENGVLTPTNQRPDKQRVVKVSAKPKFHTTMAELLKSLTHEVSLMQVVKNLHVKPLVAGDERVNIVMGRAPGETLLDVLNKGNLTAQQRFDLSINLLKELKNIHDAGIIHRDIKPENIMYDVKTGRVTILDYGLSRKMDNDDGKGVGTPGYAAPEVYKSDSVKSSKASDIFSMGVVLSLVWEAEFNSAMARKEVMDAQNNMGYDYQRPLFVFKHTRDIEGLQKEFSSDFINDMTEMVEKMTDYSPFARGSVESTLKEMQALDKKYSSRWVAVNKPTEKIVASPDNIALDRAKESLYRDLSDLSTSKTNERIIEQVKAKIVGYKGGDITPLLTELKNFNPKENEKAFLEDIKAQINHLPNLAKVVEKRQPEEPAIKIGTHKVPQKKATPAPVRRPARPISTIEPQRNVSEIEIRRIKYNQYRKQAKPLLERSSEDKKQETTWQPSKPRR